MRGHGALGDISMCIRIIFGGRRGVSVHRVCFKHVCLIHGVHGLCCLCDQSACCRGFHGMHYDVPAGPVWRRLVVHCLSCWDLQPGFRLDCIDVMFRLRLGHVLTQWRFLVHRLPRWFLPAGKRCLSLRKLLCGQLHALLRRGGIVSLLDVRCGDLLGSGG